MKNDKTTKTTPAKAKKPAAKTGLRVVAKAAAKTAAKKAAPKKTAAKTKTAPKAAPKAAAKKTAAPAAPGSNVFWKFLEMKEARRKEMGEKAGPATTTSTASKEGGRVHQFARFAGPRRRSV